MKLQLLVPHYLESAQEIEPLLDSVALQQAIDFLEVGFIIVDDGKDATPLPIEEWEEKYPFQIQHIVAKHKGVSATRNAALKAATADYVMFCDADDMFCHMCGLHIIFHEIDNEEFDSLISVFVEETRDPKTKTPVFVNHDMDSTFVHGKVHRRKWLIENNIKFNPALTIHEDSYFNILVQNIGNPERIKYCPYPFYLWKWRDNSICRHDPDYLLKTYNNMLDSNDALLTEFENRNMHDKAKIYACIMIMDAYYTMNKKEWLDKTNKNYRDAVEKRFAAYYQKYKTLWEEASDTERMSISNSIRTRSVMEGMPMESMTINAWLANIEKIKL